MLCFTSGGANMKVKKRIISVILTISMLIISVVPALAADISVSPISFDDNDQSSITVIMPDGDKETYDVFFTDNSVITIHDKGNSTTRLETFFDSGKSVETVYQNKVEILRKTYPSLLVKQSIKENNDYNVEPSNFVFPEKYQSIGSVSFKTNSTGVAYKISIECKQDSEDYCEKYDLNGSVTKSVQFLVNGLLTMFSPFSSVATGIASNVANNLISAGVVEVRKIGVNQIIAAVTADYVEGFVTNYSIRYKNQYGASNTGIGKAIYIKTNDERFNTVEYDEMYPQFLKKRDDKIARMIYYAYDAYGYPGVSSWSATRTVPYCTA